MKKILPLCDSPYVTSRASTAIQFSVLQTLEQNYDAWLCSDYINLRYKPDDKVRCDFYNKDFWFSDAKMFSRQSLLFCAETLNRKSVDIIKFIISSIDEGKYVTGDFNAFFIPLKIEYKTISRRDTYLIYGYDTSAEIFYMYGNTASGLLPHTVTFSEYVDSITNRDDGMFNLNIMGFNPSFDFGFSREKMKKQVLYYLNSQSEESYYDVAPLIFGINAIKKYREDILADFGTGRVITDNSFAALREHKYLMLKRVEYLRDNTDIDAGALCNEFQNICRVANEILVKRNEVVLQNRADIYQAILDLTDKLINLDTSACSHLLSIL